MKAKLVLTTILVLTLSACGTTRLKPVPTSLCPKPEVVKIEKSPSSITLDGLSFEQKLDQIRKAHEADVGLIIDLKGENAKLATWVDKCAP
jgi:hypothetical protein